VGTISLLSLASLHPIESGEIFISLLCFSLRMNHRVPALTVDGVLIQDDSVLLIERKNAPFEGSWALPGGFVEYGETTEQAISREFQEETGLIIRILQLIGVYSDPNRDPRGHTVSVVYLVERVNGTLLAGDDARIAKFFKREELPGLAFDHAVIVKDAFQRV
jgi:8-oxo-dGTP diphosphatase